MKNKIYILFIIFCSIYGEDIKEDKFIGEQYTVKCALQSSQNSVRIRFRGYSSSNNHREKFYSLQDVKDNRNVPQKAGYKLQNKNNGLHLEIQKLSILDAGSYQCFGGNFDETTFEYNDAKFSELFLSVHDANKFEYVFEELGQDKKKNNINVPAERSADALNFLFLESAPTGCDGCDGKGETRTFMFCYGHGNVGGVSKEWQCQNPNLFFLLRLAFATRKELVVVTKKSCTMDKCPGQTPSLVAKNEDKPFLKKLLSSKNPLVLHCPGQIHARSLVRWEMDDVPMLRSGLGGGLKLDSVADMKVRPDNSLLLRKIPTPKNNANFVNFSCIIAHKTKYKFQVQINSFNESSAAKYYKEHFFWSGIVLAAQSALFIFGFAVVNLYEIARDKYRFSNEKDED